jgi:hypothetical protein
MYTDTIVTLIPLFAVANFDHHCLYLNTCVGSNNYWSFFATIMSMLLLLLIEISAAVWVLAVGLESVHSVALHARVT